MSENIIELERIYLDTLRKKISHNGESIQLSLTEVEILSIFLTKPNFVITRCELLEEVWGEIVICPQTLNNYISKIRKKINRLSREDNSFTIITHHRVGYEFLHLKAYSENLS